MTCTLYASLLVISQDEDRWTGLSEFEFNFELSFIESVTTERSKQ